MLTLEEAGWALSAFKFYSILNVVPIRVDLKSGKIQRQTRKVRVFIWRILFGIGISQWLYSFGRILQSTVLEPEKYFRWDHFVIHFGLAFAVLAFYFTAFVLFVRNPEENVMIFNQLFSERENLVQKMKMMDQSKQLQMQTESGNANGKQGSKIKEKSGAQLETKSARESNKNRAIEKQSKSGSSSGTRARPRPLLTWPPQYSLDELVVKVFPWAVVFTEVVLLLILAIDPTRPQLLYSALPPEWQNVWSFLFLLAVEAVYVALMAFNCGFAITAQVLFFSKCQLEFKRISLQLKHLQEKLQTGAGTGTENVDGDREREIGTLRQILAEMRELAFLIELFNRCFPFPIFAWKMYSLSGCIIFYFFVIRHHDDFPILALFMGYSALAVTVVYTVMYGHAFSIPGKMEDLKQEFLLTAQKITSSSTSASNVNANSNSNSNGNKNVRAEMTREIKRIRNVGIKVGNFNKMERESTPNFVDFVLRNVVTLLVTFPR